MLNTLPAQPISFLAWFEAKLAAELASFATDADRGAYLARADKVWSDRLRRYVATGGGSEQPHPELGLPLITDMHGFVSAIAAEQRKLTTEREAA